MQLFYSPDVSGEFYEFPEEESRHIVKVLRLKKGDMVNITDGKGNIFSGEITEADQKHCKVNIQSRQTNVGKRGFGVHIAIAPTKNIKRFEWFLEKSTEIGIDRITPLKCKHSERDQIRRDRLERVISAAMKQSLKAYHPVLEEMKDFQTYIEEEIDSNKYIAMSDDTPKPHLKNIVPKGQDVSIIIGPEGDFHEKEKEEAIKMGFQAVSIGESRLRTETAGVVACHIVHLLNA